MKIDGIEVHKSITDERLLDLAEQGEATLGSPGLCIICGKDAEGVEPDARKYCCESCGERGVYGVEELIICTAA